MCRVATPPSTRYTKSRDNQTREHDAIGFVLGTDPRFQRPTTAVKRRILELFALPADGEWTDQTFDLIVTAPGTPPLTDANIADFIDRVALVEVKATKKAIRNTALNGFFFGTTDRQYQLARAAGDRYWYAFIVLNAHNDYGHPFYVLLPLAEVERRTQSKRLQYQVSFRRDIKAADLPPSKIPAELLRQAKAEEAEAPQG